MTTVVGTGRHTYEAVRDYCKPPAGWTLGSVSAVAVDSQGRIYIGQQRPGWKRDHSPEMRTYDPPIVVFDKDGNYLNSFGAGVIAAPHTFYIKDDILYVADRGDHVAVKMTLDGKPLIEMGTRGQASDTGCTEPEGEVLRPGGPFNEPLRMVPGPSGDLYVADGYCNCRIHRFSAVGELISSWGTFGHSEPYEIHSPHSAFVDRDGLIYVCDRRNNRIQIFSPTGDFVDQWKDMEMPTDIFITPDDTVYMLERESHQAPEHSVSVRDKKGNLLARWMTPPSHQLWVDSVGDVFVTAFGESPTKYIKNH